MQKKYTVTTSTKYGARILGSFKNVGFGILIFLAAFVVLFFNEGRVNYSKIAKKSISVSPSRYDGYLKGKPVDTYGPIFTDESISDNLFLLSDNYVAFKRTVEMYAWDQRAIL
jgi:hypothetical protein